MYTKHHIIPQSRGGNSQKDNLVWLPEQVHVNLHRLFENKTPVEQIEHIMNINSTALQERWKKKVAEILYVESEYVYKDGLLKPKRHAK